jgi:hypothetical protein
MRGFATAAIAVLPPLLPRGEVRNGFPGLVLGFGNEPKNVTGARRTLTSAYPREDGEGRNRTGDTTVFSRVLYQLSYLALRGQSSLLPS